MHHELESFLSTSTHKTPWDGREGVNISHSQDSSHPLHAPPDIGPPPGCHSEMHHEEKSLHTTSTHKRHHGMGGKRSTSHFINTVHIPSMLHQILDHLQVTILSCNMKRTPSSLHPHTKDNGMGGKISTSHILNTVHIPSMLHQISDHHQVTILSCNINWSPSILHPHTKDNGMGGKRSTSHLINTVHIPSMLHQTLNHLQLTILSCNMKRTPSSLHPHTKYNGMGGKRSTSHLINTVHIPSMLHQILDHLQVTILSCNMKRTPSSLHPHTKDNGMGGKISTSHLIKTVHIPSMFHKTLDHLQLTISRCTMKRSPSTLLNTHKRQWDGREEVNISHSLHSSHPLHAPPDIGPPPGDHSQLHHEEESFLSTSTHKRQWDGREEVNISLHQHSSHPLHAPPDIGPPPCYHSEMHHEENSFHTTSTHKRQWDGREDVSISHS